jgi:hypothetical protein
METMVDRPLVLFGHSLGALLAFATARALRQRTGRLPAHLIVSARGAPHRSNPDRSILAMTDPELVATLRRHGGTAPAILADPLLERDDGGDEPFGVAEQDRRPNTAGGRALQGPAGSSRGSRDTARRQEAVPRGPLAGVGRADRSGPGLYLR